MPKVTPPKKMAVPTPAKSPIDFTQLPATCVCGKPLMLILQQPSTFNISWRCYCPSCKWHVSVVLTR